MKIKKTIKVNYVGFWKGYDYHSSRIHQILEKYYSVCISEEPDYVICSVYNNEWMKYENAIRIFYTAENVIPDFNLFDYCIGFDEISFGDRYIRIPNYLINLKYEKVLELMLQKHRQLDLCASKKFCGYVCSNGNADYMRDYIFDKLAAYKEIASGGRYRNNIGKPDGVEDKLEFQKQYKFALALENTSYKGYTTEKIVEAFAAGGIPIYWGDPDVKTYFNEKAFINLMDYSTVEEAIEEIKRIDNDQELYRKYLLEPAVLPEYQLNTELIKLEEFLLHIVEQPIENAKRRVASVWYSNISNIVKLGSAHSGGEKISLKRRLESILRKN